MLNCSIINADSILTTNKKKVVAYESGMNRRDFLKIAASAGLLTGILGAKPVFAKVELGSDTFTKHQNETMIAVQQILFPDDGDGPSAIDLNALQYLQWALKDPDNLADGDPTFLIKGLVSIDVFTQDLFGKNFTALSTQQQDDVLIKVERSSFGENWLSLILYYLMEALLLDPVYGGNPNGVGWKWLEHQAGFPRPNAKQTYINYKVVGDV